MSRSPTRTIQGEVVDLTVVSGEAVLIQGAAHNVSVSAGASLNVQGALAGSVRVERDGALSVAGAITGTLAIHAGGFAIVTGALTGVIEVSGRLVLDALITGGRVDVRDGGQVLKREDLSPELRASLPRMEITQS